MKHVKLFEGWEQSEMDFETVPEISPEQFGQEVDHAVNNMSPADAARHVNKIMVANPRIRKEPKDFLMPLRKLDDHMKKMSQAEKDELLREVHPERYEAQAGRRESSNKIASVLDQFAAGEISKEEAIARLA